MKFPLDNLSKYNIYLASGSPRRRELLAMLGVDFTRADLVEVDEIVPDGLDAAEVPLYLANLKAEAYRGIAGAKDLYITADTVVIVDGRIIGKPHDEADARAMLRLLAGRKHTVVTGVCVFTPDRTENFSVSSEVEFSELSDSEIDYYVSTFRPLDKAGAYGIQEWIGAAAVRGIDGSFYNVMGLPVNALYQVLKTF